MSRLFRIFWIGLWGLYFTADFAWAQISPAEKDSVFLNYLLESKQFEDAILLSKRLIQTNTIHTFSPEYYAGFSHYNIRQLDSAAFYLGQVPETNRFFLKSRFFQGLSLAYQGKYAEANQVYHRLPVSDTILQEVQQVELAGVALIRRDYQTFDELTKKFSFNYYSISQQETNFLEYKKKLLAVRKKSPALAGALSTVVPGLGKIYAGQLGQGIAIFLQSTIFAAQAYEGYRKDGPQSARFLIYGGLFTVFHFGNIWGSVFSVKISRQEKYDQINNQILFDMHIPLRTLFN